MKIKKSSGPALLLMAATVIAPAISKASLITGVLNTTGTVSISTGAITFNPIGGTTANLQVNSPASSQQGGFMALAGIQGTVTNLVDTTEPTGVALSVPNFVTFPAPFSNISITLNEILPGIDPIAGCLATPPAAGQLCTPPVPGSPTKPSTFNLQNTSATSSSASFNILGTEVDSSTNTSIPVTGTFSTPFTTQPFQSILGTVLAGGTVTTAFSAQFATAAGTPEPGSLFEMLGGATLLGFAWVSRKRITRS